MLSALGFEFANKEKKALPKEEPQSESDVYPKTFSESKYLLFYSEQVFALASTNEAESMRENSNVLCQEILGRSQSASGIYIGAFTKDFIVVYRNIEGRLDQYYKVLSEEVRSIWFSNTGRFLLVSAKRGNDNTFLIVDLELRSIVSDF